jgi:hypothetical protein
MNKTTITFFLLLFTVVISYAQSVGTVFTFGGINYKITSTHPREVEVAEHESFKGAVNIPATVLYFGNFYSVTAIGKFAFFFCKELTSVWVFVK